MQLKTTTFNRRPLDTPPHFRVDHEPADLGKFAAAALKQLELEARAAKDLDERQRRWRSGRLETFMLAWFCFHHGLGELSEKLYDQASNKEDKLIAPGESGSRPGIRRNVRRAVCF